MTISNLIKSQSAPRIDRLPLRGGTWFALYGTLPSGNQYQIAGGDFHFVCRIARQLGLINRPSFDKQGDEG